MLVTSCGGNEGLQPEGETAPEEGVSTPTVRKSKGELLPCQKTAIPNATLAYEDQVQAKARVAVNWWAADCAISAHPFSTLPLPREPLRIPQGARPSLKLQG